MLFRSPTSVTCVSFEDLLRQIEYIDLLHVDTEGYDLELLRLYDFGRFAPAIVRFEHVHLTRAEWDEAVALLATHGYRFVREEYDTTAYAPTRTKPTEVSRSSRPRA